MDNLAYVFSTGASPFSPPGAIRMTDSLGLQDLSQVYVTDSNISVRNDATKIVMDIYLSKSPVSLKFSFMRIAKRVSWLPALQC